MAGVHKTERDKLLGMTTSWNDSLQEMIQANREFRRVFLAGAVESMVTGDVQVGKSLTRKYVNATVGFIALGEALGKSSKTLMQMLGPKGNPNIRNFFEIVAYLQKVDGFEMKVVNGGGGKRVSKGPSRSKTKVPARTLARKAA